MSKQNFKSQLRSRSIKTETKPRSRSSIESRVYVAPNNEQLFNFAVVFLESRMMFQLSDIQRAILKETLEDEEHRLMWQQRHKEFQEELWHRDGEEKMQGAV